MSQGIGFELKDNFVKDKNRDEDFCKYKLKSRTFAEEYHLIQYVEIKE